MELLETPIKELMEAQVITITTKDSLNYAKELMRENSIHHLPVTLDDEIVGMLSNNDLKKVEYISEFVGGKTSNDSSFAVVDVEELMTKCLMVLGEESILRDAVELFSMNEFQALPVVHGAQVVGIVTTKDVFSYILNHR